MPPSNAPSNAPCPAPAGDPSAPWRSDGPGSSPALAARTAHPCLAPTGTAAAEPSPGLDLARLLVPTPRRSLLLRVWGDSMVGAGIQHGDLLVVERIRRAPPAGAIVVARLGGCFTLKRLRRHRGRCWLEAAHPAYPPLELEAMARGQGLTEGEVQLWGVAVHVIRSL